MNTTNDSMETDLDKTWQLESLAATYLLMAVVQFNALVQVPK